MTQTLEGNAEANGAEPEYTLTRHRDPSQKRYHLSQMRYFSLVTVQAEIAKCDVVCANCHRIRTFNSDAVLEARVAGYAAWKAGN
jgi:hypothetical protein